jgi:hypothetical protein
MKFNLPLIADVSLEQAPEILSQVLSALNGIEKGGLTIEDNILTQTIKTRLLNGVNTVVKHKFKNTPSTVTLNSGRVLCMALKNKSNSEFTVAVKLLSTQSIAQEPDFSEYLFVLDPTLFVEGDRIKVGVEERTILSIFENRFRLNQNLLLQDSVPVTLAEENCFFVLM